MARQEVPMRLELDVSKNVEKNAEVYFEQAKKARKKAKGAKEAVEKLGQRIKQLEKKIKEEQKEEEKPPARERKWYEKFRWFFTSDGFLVIGGRDAATNEIAVKKQAEKGDVVFHTDMAGSPFFVIKAEGKKISDKAMRETADATCTFSRAWKLGLVAQSVFYVQPHQLTKTARAGEFVQRGAFVVKGKTTYLDNKVNCAVGMTEDGIPMGGPIEAVKKHCKKYVVLDQGDEKTSSVAKKIQRIIGGDLDDIIRVMPSGGARIRKL